MGSELKRINDSRASAGEQDAELILRIVEGDEAAFEQLMERYAHSVLNTIYHYVGNRDEAEDIAQKVFIAVWKHAQSIRKKSSFSTWLYRVVVNECLDHRKQERSRLDVAFSHPPDPEDHNCSKMASDRVGKAEIVRNELNLLPERQRLAIVLSKFEGRSYREVARIMGVSVSAVESLIFRGRIALKKRLLPLRKRGEI